MPYIKPTVRSEFSGWLNPLTRFIEERGVTPGELNYLITKLMHAALPKNAGYEDYMDSYAAAIGASMEFYRRRLGPYEDEKIKENGDV